MNFTREELKSQAKEQMQGKLGPIILCFLIYGAVAGVSNSIPYVGILGAILVTPPLFLGLTNVWLNVTYGEEPNIGTLFESFSTNFGKSIGLLWLMSLYIFLWSLLLIVPGIVMSYAYSQSFRILAENPDMSVTECLKASKEMMMGKKMDLFVLHLSFIPWILLVLVTCGIASLYVSPYMLITETNFYHRVKTGGDGTDLYTAPEGSILNKAQDIANDFTGALDNASDKVEDITDNISDKVENIADDISDKF
ncbi:MAG: DUF975 family protein [Lachnospiraceae bacterium]|nr:DUF975 family protein [Lachnospiraceae bacterium]